MIIGYGRPSEINWAVAGSPSGGQLLGPVANLDDNRPDTLSAFTWLTGTQNTSSTLLLRGVWSTPIVPGLVGLSNIQLPVGTKVQVAFRRTADAVGTYPYSPAAKNNPQRIFAGPRGEQTVWIWLNPGASACIGVEIRISNDVNGVASIAAALPFWLGEAWVSPSVEIDIEDSWSPGPTDPLTTNYSWTKQPYTIPGVVYRQLTFQLLADNQTKYFGDSSNPTALDYEELFANLDRGQTAVYIPRYVDVSGAFSPWLLHRTAMMGIATSLPKPTHQSGPLFNSSQITVVEAPIPT